MTTPPATRPPTATTQTAISPTSSIRAATRRRQPGRLRHQLQLRRRRAAADRDRPARAHDHARLRRGRQPDERHRRQQPHDRLQPTTAPTGSRSPRPTAASPATATTPPATRSRRTDANNHQTSYSYDHANRLIQVTGPDPLTRPEGHRSPATATTKTATSSRQIDPNGNATRPPATARRRAATTAPDRLTAIDYSDTHARRRLQLRPGRQPQPA